MEDYSYVQLRNRHPQERSSILSRLTFLYTLPTFILGYRKEITEDDLYKVLPEHKSAILSRIANKLWKIEQKNARFTKRKPAIKRVLIKLFMVQYLKIGFLIAIVELFIKPYQAIQLRNLISFYSVTSEEEVLKSNNPAISAASIILCSFVTLCITQPCLMASLNMGLKMRIICSCLIYRKLLKLNKTAFDHTTSGQIINLFSNDVNILDRIVFSSYYIWIGPIQAFIIMYLMYQEVGISFVFGVALLVLFLPFYSFMGKQISKYRLKTSKRRDERIRFMNEIIQGIKVIKMYTWEKPFSKMISAYRKSEIESITITSYIKETFSFYTVSITTSIFLTISSSIIWNKKMPSSSVFFLTNIIITLGISLTFLFPQGIAVLSEAKVSFKRITNFLLHDEKTRRRKTNGHHDVLITEGSVNWNKSLVLTNLNLHIPSGKITTIIGPVGCGKSTLLQVILGEVPLSSGRMLSNGSFSYCTQDPWIFTGSVRQNILFGSKLNITRYEQVIKCCGLSLDLKLFPYGDQTTVGERGALLSGGQKTRINLARAVYKEADIYLLDDPFSSVDLCVGKQIFEECILTFLKGKTVILITHQLQYVNHTDYLIVIENKSIRVEGSPVQLEQLGVDFTSYVQNSSAQPNDSENFKLTLTSNEKYSKTVEERSSGFISWSVYKEYLSACRSIFLIFSCFTLFVLTQMVISGSYYFLAFWIAADQNDDAMQMHIYIYCAITLAHIILTALRSLACVSVSMKSSVELHKTIISSLIYSGLAFFNSNPSGRILNRFSKDLGTIDELLPNSMFTALKTTLSILGILLVICLVNPVFLIPTIVVAIAFYYIRKFYLTSSLSIMRVEGAVRSPLYAHINASVEGLTTIRALGVRKVVAYDFENHLDLHSSAFYLSITAARAFSYYTDVICFIYLTIITFYYTSIASDSYVGNVGLAVTQAMQLIGLLQYGVKQVTETENYMTSVERLLEYKSLESESTAQQLSFPKLWPSRGQIIFINVFLKYPPSDQYTLLNLNFIVQPQEKIGIVGRTGAGKSSLISAIFRLADIEGAILIDQMDVKHLDLHRLRSSITIIPQNPFLFSSTVRKNLDPFNEFQDDVLWKALEDVKLKNIFSDLNEKISDNGSNLSIGQRQLLCLARAVVTKNKILILDEATANVDFEVEKCIQETIKQHFSSSTVLTIAHRLSTVVNYDKILVMDNGEIVEYNHPSALLEDPKSIFTQMMHEVDTSQKLFK